MRPTPIAITAILVAVVVLGLVWNRKPLTDSLAQDLRPAPDGNITRRSPETERAREVLDARTKGSYGFDIWRETVCNGVSLFYHPDADDEYIAWYWFDLQTGELTEHTTLNEVIRVLVPHLEGFEPYPAAFQIAQLITPEGRPLYSIGTERLGGLVQIGFSPNRCSAIPDIAQIMMLAGPSPIDIDLPAAVERLRQQKQN